MKLNFWEYWIGHCWRTGWQTIGSTFRIWSDLLGSNYEDYALLKDDDPLTECCEWFWVSLGEDNVYSKEYLEYLYQLAENVHSGQVTTYSFEEISELLMEDGSSLIDNT